MGNKNNKNIAFYLHAIYNGGVERVFSALARSLITYGYAVDVVVNRFSHSPMRGEFPQQCNFIDLGCCGYIDRLPKLTAYLEREKPVALLSAGHFANEIAVLAVRRAKTRTRVVVSEHTNNGQELRTMPIWHPRRIFMPLVAHILYPKADGIVTVSNGVKKDIERLFHLKPGVCTTIYNPVDIIRVRRLAEERCNYSWCPDDLPYVIAIGRLEVAKDYPTLLKAFRTVRDKRACKLIILGVGSLKKTIEGEIARLALERDVVMSGFINNPYPLIKRAACLALSSCYEGFGIVIVEALALGTPVVATDCESGPREVLQGGRYGTLIPVGDANALAYGILDALDSPRSAIQEESVAPYAMERVFDDYLKVLQL